MRITGFSIDGFGVFCDQTADNLAPGLTVFFGENEAGKSTLLAFIRSMLFGFPSRRRNRFDPLRGGDYGGTLTADFGHAETFIIERRGARLVAGELALTCPDGSRAGEERLRRLLGFVTQDLFHSVFAFTLNELQQLENLNSDEVKGVIYSAGMGSVRKSLPLIDKQLETQAQSIFKPGGQVPEINRLLKELDDIAGQLRAIQGNAARYDELQEELSSREREIELLEQQKREQSLKLKATERLLLGWDHWTALESARSELNELPSVERFPDNGIAELDRLARDLSEARKQLEEESQKQKTREERQAEAVVDGALLAQASRIRRLQKGRDRYDDAVKDFPARREEHDGLNRQLAGKLAELGQGWDREKLTAFDVSVGRREAIRRHQDSVRVASETSRDARSELQAAQKAVEAANKQAAEAKGAFDSLAEPAERDDAKIAARIGSIRETERLFGSCLRLQGSLESLKQRASDLGAQVQPSGGQAVGFGRVLPRLFQLIPLAGLAIAIIGLRDRPGLAVTIGALALVSGYVLHRARKAQLAMDSSMREQTERLESRRTDIESKSAEVEKELEHIKANIRNNLTFLGISEGASEADLAEQLTRTEADLDHCRRWRQAKAEVDKAEKAAREAREVAQAASLRLDEASSALESVQAAWSRWLSDAGLSDELTPSGALDVLSRVEACRTIDDSLQGLSKRISLIEREVQKYGDGVKEVAEACGRATDGELDPGLFLDRLAEELSRAEKAKAQRDKLSESIAELSERTDGLRNRLSALEAELGRLLESGGATGEQEFRERARLYGRRQELEHEIRRRRGELERIAGPGRLSELESMLRTSQMDELEFEKKELGERLERGDEQRREADRRWGELNREIEQLAREEESSALRLRKEELLAKLALLAEKWCVYTLSREVLRKAQAIYERERQPRVITESSRFFEKITDGRYVQILTPPADTGSGGTNLDVLSRAGQRLGLEQLSQGTLEQLLLSVRLGLASEFGRQTEKLPLIMDDVLVNFDAERARATASVLCELGKTHQVLLFTCHRETLELVRDVAPHTQVFRLADDVITRE